MLKKISDSPIIAPITIAFTHMDCNMFDKMSIIVVQLAATLKSAGIETRKLNNFFTILKTDLFMFLFHVFFEIKAPIKHFSARFTTPL